MTIRNILFALLSFSILMSGQVYAAGDSQGQAQMALTKQKEANRAKLAQLTRLDNELNQKRNSLSPAKLQSYLNFSVTVKNALNACQESSKTDATDLMARPTCARSIGEAEKAYAKYSSTEEKKAPSMLNILSVKVFGLGKRAP